MFPFFFSLPSVLPSVLLVRFFYFVHGLSLFISLFPPIDLLVYLKMKLKKSGNVQGNGTESFGKRRNKTHTLCVRCGRHSFHFQNSRCSTCAFPATRKRTYNWSVKAIRRKTTRTGRMRYLRHGPRRFKTGFREGTEAALRKKVAAASTSGITRLF
ncbi:hypothetical protein ES332_D11G238400v1 [Gossypium tomentosum]|uniref:Ribosomal protein L37 n=1 Tax=Gossypium tomentosum TaxID=34277 RepID=A0A5D2ISY2_GOSTO|nr:hypothetical protein ES332_D11G238400v1 [Gossypium tomentosum]